MLNRGPVEMESTGIDYPIAAVQLSSKSTFWSASLNESLVNAQEKDSPLQVDEIAPFNKIWSSSVLFGFETIPIEKLFSVMLQDSVRLPSSDSPNSNAVSEMFVVRPRSTFPSIPLQSLKTRL